MVELKVFHDREGGTLTVWFMDPSREYVCEETGDEVVLMKDAAGRVIGFEKLNFSIPGSDSFESLSKPRQLEAVQRRSSGRAVPFQKSPLRRTFAAR